MALKQLKMSFPLRKISVLSKMEQNRSTWPLARMLNVYHDENGIIREEEVIFKGQRTLITINEAIPLERSSENPDEVSRLDTGEYRS